jgi:hypothetical protein
MKSDPAKIAQTLVSFTGPKLTVTLAKVEGSIQGLTLESCHAFLEDARANSQALAAAAEMKRLAGQINVVIHALGILLCLPHILEEGETVEYVSLGAGNTGRSFDLETNKKVAEFKFINWRGGPEAIRQNSIFKDIFQLMQHSTNKQKILYLLDTKHPKKFLQGRRSLESILRQNAKMKIAFEDAYGNQYKTIGEWYACYHHEVELVNVSQLLSELTENYVAHTSDAEVL